MGTKSDLTVSGTTETNMDKAARSEAGSGAGSGDQFRVIERAIDVLKCMSRHPEGVTLTKISLEVNLHKATVLRLLKAFERGGVASHGKSSKSWVLGPALFEMTARAGGRNDIREISRPIMEGLSQRINQTVQLAILAEGEVLYIEKVEPPNLAIRVNAMPGSRRPLHCTALGKVLAAYQNWDEIKQILLTRGMPPLTERTLVTPKAYREALEKTRAQNFAVDDREYNNLVSCVAAPIRDMTGQVVAGVSISTIGESVDSLRFEKLAMDVRETAGKLSRNLGYQGE